MTHAPAQLVLAPRPIPTELLSSWLLRVAAANLVTLQELLAGFEAHYGRVLSNTPIDYGIPEGAVNALSRFSRVAPEMIRMLDLRVRAAGLTSSMLLRFENVGWCRPRYRLSVRYAFCPSCLGDQRVFHFPWDWSVSCLVRCTVHRRHLLDGCPTCGELDPLTLTEADIRCRSCGESLTGDMGGHDHGLHTVEECYRAALTGAAPVMLKRTTDEEFRRFVEEMFELLTQVLEPCSGGRPHRADSFLRQDICDIIAALVLNAASSSNKSTRNGCRTRGLRMWAALLNVIPEYRGHSLEKASLRWPVALRRRFLSGLYHRYRKRWPHTPYRAFTHLGSSVKRSEIAGIFGLADRTNALAPAVGGRRRSFHPGFECKSRFSSWI